VPARSSPVALGVAHPWLPAPGGIEKALEDVQAPGARRPGLAGKLESQAMLSSLPDSSALLCAGLSRDPNPASRAPVSGLRLIQAFSCRKGVGAFLMLRGRAHLAYPGGRDREMVTQCSVILVALRKAWLCLSVAEPADCCGEGQLRPGSQSSPLDRPANWREKAAAGGNRRGPELQDQGIARERVRGMAGVRKTASQPENAGKGKPGSG